MNIFNKTLKLAFPVCLIIFLLLLYKDPFSTRTLIPNFEPYPDTFNYINPALSWVKGGEFNLNREGRAIEPTVPPLYSFSLIPSFIIKADPRMSYYSNVSLAVISLILFWAICKRIFTNKLVIALLLVLYITNYFLYWVPTIVMAENLTITLYLASILLLVSKLTKLNAVLMAALAVGLYATKYANIPSLFTITFIFLAKVFLFSNLVFKEKIKLIFYYLASALVCYTALSVFESVVKQNNVIAQILGHLTSIFNSVPKTVSNSETVSRSPWFSLQYMGKNLPMYIDSLVGKPNRFLWDYTPLVPTFFAVCGFVGIFVSIATKKFRLLSITFLLFIATTVIFMSTFYSFDARYIYIVIPTLLFGFGLLLSLIEDGNQAHGKKFVTFLCLIILSVYLLANFTRIKSQISLNLRYSETPWSYVSVLKLNEYFSESRSGDEKPFLISALPPYFIDYYSNGNYRLLPLSYQQEYRDRKEVAWGPGDYSDLIKLYTRYLEGGEKVYVGRYGLGNEGYTNEDFRKIQENFELELVQEGCFSQCNIYKLNLKSD